MPTSYLFLGNRLLWFTKVIIVLQVCMSLITVNQATAGADIKFRKVRDGNFYQVTVTEFHEFNPSCMSLISRWGIAC